MRNLKLILAYDGSRYQGWQRLPGVENTIQGKLERTISRILEEPVEVSGSGRTDAGAHAIGQCASFHCQSTLPCSEILSQLRMHLPEDIGVLSCEEAPPRFHARLNATAKTYEYRVWNSPEPCVFQRKYWYRLPVPLNLEAMEAAAAHLVGQHDFRSFCSNKKMKKPNNSIIPTLFLYGENDPVAGFGKGIAKVYKAYHKNNKDTKICCIKDAAHDILHDQPYSKNLFTEIESYLQGVKQKMAAG